MRTRTTLDLHRARERFPEKVTVSLPGGTVGRIEWAAEASGMGPAEWHRAVIRKALDAARKRYARKAA